MDEEEEDEEDEEDVGTDCCVLCPFLLVTLLVTGGCLVSSAGAGDGVSAGVELGAWGGSTGVGDDVGAGDDCFDDGCCCLNLSSDNLRGGVSHFLRGGSSFAGAGEALVPGSEFGPFTGLRPSFFSDNLFFFLSFLPLPCF